MSYENLTLAHEGAAAILTLVVVVVYHSMASRSTGTGAAGWDPVSLAQPFPWLGVVMGIFVVGFLWEFSDSVQPPATHPPPGGPPVNVLQ